MLPAVEIVYIFVCIYIVQDVFLGKILEQWSLIRYFAMFRSISLQQNKSMSKVNLHETLHVILTLRSLSST